MIAENFHNLEKETDTDSGSKDLKRFEQDEVYARTCPDSMAEVEDRQRLLKAARGKGLILHKGGL